MNLGEKIFRLRKERGLSQEALAERLGTTRQAVSKWENNQGFPETEKLLQLSNIFEVSTDFLLKDDKTVQGAAEERGYYVSREMAAGYIVNQRKVSKYVSAGLMCLALAGVPYVMFAAADTWRWLGMAVCIAAGIIFIVTGMFAEEEEYRILKQEPLLFDYECMKELTGKYAVLKRKYAMTAVPCTTLFILGILALAVTARGYMPWSEYHSFVFLGFSVGLFGFSYSAGVMEAYELLVKNERHTGSLFFRLRRKINEKIK